MNRRQRAAICRVSKWCLALTVVMVVGLLMTASVPAGALTQAQLKAKALSLSNMPIGWSVDNSSSGGTSNLGGCLQNLQALGHPPKGITRVQVNFDDQNLPSLQETLEGGKGASNRYQRFVKILQGCKSISFTDSSTGDQVTGSVGAMSFPTVGNSSSAFAINLSIKGISAGIDIVLFRVGDLDGDIVYGDLSPDASVVQGFATEAVNKIDGQPATPPEST